MQTTHPRHFAIVPAAGSGSRMAAARPKQYLSLLGRPLIHHALSVLCAAPAIDAVFVVLSVDDAEWATHDWSALGPQACVRSSVVVPRVPTACSAACARSPGRPLRAIGCWCTTPRVPAWRRWHVDKLVRELAHDEVGGLLAVPVADTLKRADEHRHVRETVPRDSLWQAQTPQMFRYAMLRRALEGAREVTDEASAIESAGLRPRLVQGDATNLKVTYPLDLHLAEWILKNREGHNA